MVSALRTYGFARKLRSVRVNAYDTAWCDEDIVVVMEGAGDKVDSLVAGQMERKLRLKTRVGLELLIESAHGVENIGLIAAASDRNEALIFGPADLAASLRIAAAFNSLMQVAAERIRRTGPYPHLLARTFGADDGGWLG